MMPYQIRTILPDDNRELATIVRDTLAEFGANHPGTVYYDETTDTLYEVFREPGSIYYVATVEDRLMGGSGIFPSPGLPSDTCELVKMYLRPEARGQGLGIHLINKCLEFAKQAGYRHIYLESMPELKKAIGLYERLGFRHLKGPMGNTGHSGCAIWMLLDL